MIDLADYRKRAGNHRWDGTTGRWSCQQDMDALLDELEKAQSKAQAWDELRDLVAEFGDTPDAQKVIGEHIGQWEHGRSDVGYAEQWRGLTCRHGNDAADCLICRQLGPPDAT